MTDAQLYVALIDKSIAFRKANDQTLDDINAYGEAARQIILANLWSGTLIPFYREVDRLREEAKNK